MSLSTYLQKNGLSYDDFGQMIGVTATSVYRYAMGDRFPRPSILSRIKKATRGEITYDVLLDSIPKKNGRKQ
jgi:predicted transcriptional regulator